MEYKQGILLTMFQSSLFQPNSLSVSELTRYLRQLMESDEILRDIWVRGEISNISRPSSGHIYFTLKDAGAALKGVIWRSTALKLRVPIESGMAVEAHGYLSIYERDGQYQIYVDAIRFSGEGYLYQEFLRLKARLEAEGLFEEDRKKPIPIFPHTIGIVTSATGAALQDMLNTLQKRFPLALVILAPAAVQGDEAPPAISGAIKALNRQGKADVILVARGGGSLEDLWAFNDERVVRAIADSVIPVVTGIGHETDFTLADFAADLRAPTPTGAAVLATPDVADIRRTLAVTERNLTAAFEEVVAVRVQALENYRVQIDHLSPLRQIQNDRQRLDQISQSLQLSLARTLQLHHSTLNGIQNRLLSLNPQAVLDRGYAIVSGSDQKIKRTIKDISPDEWLNIRLRDGSVTAQVQNHPEATSGNAAG